MQRRRWQSDTRLRDTTSLTQGSVHFWAVNSTRWQSVEQVPRGPERSVSYRMPAAEKCARRAERKKVLNIECEACDCALGRNTGWRSNVGAVNTLLSRKRLHESGTGTNCCFSGDKVEENRPRTDKICSSPERQRRSAHNRIRPAGLSRYLVTDNCFRLGSPSTTNGVWAAPPRTTLCWTLTRAASAG